MKTLSSRALSLIVAVVIFSSLSVGHASSRPDSDRVRIVVWGLWDTEGDRVAIAEFEKRNPDIEVVVARLGPDGFVDPQKLLTAVAGGVPPDVLQQDRFQIGEWAFRGTFRPLNDLIERDDFNLDQFFDTCLMEAVYEDRIYGIPRYTDGRGLYYNKQAFRQAGLDPDRPPRTWEELRQYALKLTSRDGDRLSKAGFIPMYGNSFLYMYGWLNGGEFMSADGSRATLNDPRIVEALGWVVDFYDMFGGADEVESFISGFQANQYDPFIIGQLAMVIDGSWVLDRIASFAPGLEFGVAPPPAPKGREPITWSGGFALVIPSGAPHPEASWRFIKWMTSVEGWKAYCEGQKRYNELRGNQFVPPLTASREADAMIRDLFAPKLPHLRAAFESFQNMMSISKFRPVTPVGNKMWDEQLRASEDAIRHKATPQEALDTATRNVQKELDYITQFSNHIPLRWAPVLVTIGLIMMLGLIALVGMNEWAARRSPLARGEARAGMLFAAPWILGFMTLMAGPILVSLVLSFTSYNVLLPPVKVGLFNFRELLFHDALFRKSLYNTLFVTVIAVPLSTAIGLGLALMVRRDTVRGISIYRTLYYIPSIVPIVATSILWIWILHSEFGLLNTFIRFLNHAVFEHLGFQIGTPHWLQSPVWAKPAIILTLLWAAGGGLIFWLAALKSVPIELYEAAEVDGAGKISQFFFVTVPIITPYIFFSVVMGIISTMQIFTQAFIMTPGGRPAGSTYFYVYYLFDNAFRYFKMGYASAMAWILFVIILVLTLIQLTLSKKWVHYG
ncbi:MAG: hypothetical protein Kow0059_09880 [Candidatus Sumerlaeia bacterium]